MADIIELNEKQTWDQHLANTNGKFALSPDLGKRANYALTLYQTVNRGTGTGDRETTLNYNLTQEPYIGAVNFSIAATAKLATTEAPPEDSGVLTFGWDNSGWGAQLAIGNYKSPHLYIRGANPNSDKNNSDWDTSWLTVLDSGNWTNYIGPNHITMSAGKYIYNSDKIYMNDGVNSGNRMVIQMVDDGDGNNYGSEIIFGASGNTFIGAGESFTGYRNHLRNYLTDATTYPLKTNETYSASSEGLYLSADSNIYFASNCNTVANRNVMVYNNAGALIVPTGTQYSTYKARNIAAGTSDMTAGSTALASGNIFLVYE